MQSNRLKLWLLCLVALFAAAPLHAADHLLVEAESFEKPGGWCLDTQFIEIMGSPYMLAHGMGRPVDDATTTVTFPAPGTYHMYVRTKDWVARWKAPGAPGKFQVLVNGKPSDTTFGTEGADWFWQDGGKFTITDKSAVITLHDLTGFDGRADAIYFTTDDNDAPPNEGTILPAWRKKLLGLSDAPIEEGPFDLVVVGGGYSGMGAAISAARMGCKVALIQDRPVLGGNGSSEVRVWAQGLIRRGKYPTIGEIVEEFADSAKKSPGTYEEFEDAKKEAVVRAEKNIKLFLNHHAYKVEKKGNRITAVIALATDSSAVRRFTGKLFADTTGHGTIGGLAGADFDMTEKGHMGMSNMWYWSEHDEEHAFPKTPWALDLNMADFPYPQNHHGQWFWEGGFDRDPLTDLEYVRDWNLRAVYGAFNAMKNGDGADKHKTATLDWIAYIGGPRESRRLLGDVILTEDDIISKREFPDGCVPSTWSIDLHCPKQQYAKKYPDDPFISIAKMNHAVDRNYGYPIPYRCFYSRNIDNLFMAGRDISVTHEALGTTRVMKTCGMMGEVVGKAASLCVLHDCTPRDVYHSYWTELDKLLNLKGAARRDTVEGPIYIPEGAPVLPDVVRDSLDTSKLAGTVIDDAAATKTGKWGSGTGLKPYVGSAYLYSSDPEASIRFDIKVPTSGKYEVRYKYSEHENRATKAPVTVQSADGSKTTLIDETQKPPLDKGFISLGTYAFEAGKVGAVTATAKDAGGTIHADAVQIIPVK
ncbi:MAG: FAD-dependent oxidoreductase [Planctomycetes bacterium]|nr:FAD-dependent oxidoreductase [Planctomycetota bacterium]